MNLPLTIPSITAQRAAIGLTTPTAEERAYVWSKLSIPQARISPATGGFSPHRMVRRLHNGPWRFVAEGGGLRGGKSLGSAAEGIAWLPHSELIWLAAETYDLTRQEFEYLAEGATSLDYIASMTMPKNKYQPCALETDWGCRVETRSLHDLGAAGQGASLVARAPDLIIICEPGFAPPEALVQARERLTTNRGRLWMAGTFERANTWFVDAWNAWKRWPNIGMGKSLAVPSWLNTASFPGGKHDPEIEAIRASYPTLREFLVRWGGIPLASEALVMGAYWNEKVHVSESAVFQPLDKDNLRSPVYLMIDPGFSGKSHYVVLAAHKFGSQLVVFDEVSVQSMVAEEVIDKCRTKPWWPHVAGGVIDPYAGVNHVYGGLSPQEIWWRYGRVPLEAAPRFEVEDVVSRLQHVMRDPVNARTHLVVSPACERLRWEMTHWRRIATREGLGKPQEGNCDAIKALAYFCSAKYTEEAIGYSSTRVTVHELTIDGGMGSQVHVSKADRYANYGDRGLA